VARVLALVAAVLLVVAAVLARSALDDDDSADAGGGDNGDPLAIVCVAELADVCEAWDEADAGVRVEIEDAATTEAALIAGTATADGWLTFDPWPAVVNEQRPDQAVGTPTAPIASSPLVILTVAERGEVLAADPSCGGTVGWRCLGEATGRPWAEIGGETTWGPVTTGLPPTDSGLGLLVLGNAASGYFGDTPFAGNEVRNDFEFRAWLDDLLQYSGEDDPVARFYQQFPAAFSAVGTVAVSETEARADEVGVVTPDPTATAVVVLAGLRNPAAADLADSEALAEALTGAGWSAGGPTTSGLPAAGVLIALRDV
jgi:hypothetical protein